jgi:hypothetical protein
VELGFPSPVVETKEDEDGPVDEDKEAENVLVGFTLFQSSH